jgi:hypothetical protein
MTGFLQLPTLHALTDVSLSKKKNRRGIRDAEMQGGILLI